MPFSSTKSIRERLLEKMRVNESTGCWEWVAAKDSNGYGRIWFDGTIGAAHRVSYELDNGPIPDGLLACHRCDNPACINPAHLFLGTHADNLSDMDAKGRRARGDRVSNKGVEHGRVKITENDVLAIRAAHMTHRALAKQYGLGRSQIARIRSGKQWTHI